MLALRATCPASSTAAGLTIPSRLAACVRGTFRDIADRLRWRRRGKVPVVTKSGHLTKLGY
jgi:hypothetical protein